MRNIYGQHRTLQERTLGIKIDIPTVVVVVVVQKAKSKSSILVL